MIMTAYVKPARWLVLVSLGLSLLAHRVAAKASADGSSKRKPQVIKHWCLVSQSDIVRLNLLMRHEPVHCEKKIVTDHRMTYREFIIRQWQCRTTGSAGKSACMLLQNLPNDTQFFFIVVVPSCISMLSLSFLMVLGKLNEIRDLDRKLAELSF